MYLIFLNIKLTLTGRVVIIWHYLALSPVIQDARKTTNDSNSSSSVISDGSGSDGSGSDGGGSEEGASVGSDNDASPEDEPPSPTSRSYNLRTRRRKRN
jgi:hypothetical protein